MKGKVKFSIQNNHIAFKFDFERNVTVITGDSGTGKTKLINMVRNYSELGKASGVKLKCYSEVIREDGKKSKIERPCVVLSGNNWDTVLEKTKGSIVFVEESTSFLTSHEFAIAIQQSDNYYVFVTREPLPQIPYSIDAVKQIVKNGKKPKVEKVYNGIGVKKISSFPYDLVIVEDSGSGFTFFSKASGKQNVSCISAKGKSNFLPVLNKRSEERILIIADAAALGSEIRELLKFRRESGKKIDFFLPESFEWLVLKSDIFTSNDNVKKILEKPIDYIESSEFFSWERFFTHTLVEKTKDNPDLRYSAKKNRLPKGYIVEANMDSILRAMK